MVTFSHQTSQHIYFLSYNSRIGSSRETLDDDFNIFDRILQSIVSFEEQSNNRCQFLICGDLNARSANLADFVDDSVDHVDVLPDDYSVDTPMSRMSANTGTNQFGTCPLDLCKQSGLRIVKGRFGAESGKYTYLTQAFRFMVGPGHCSMVSKYGHHFPRQWAQWTQPF